MVHISVTKVYSVHVSNYNRFPSMTPCLKSCLKTATLTTLSDRYFAFIGKLETRFNLLISRKEYTILLCVYKQKWLHECFRKNLLWIREVFKKMIEELFILTLSYAKSKWNFLSWQLVISNLISEFYWIFLDKIRHICPSALFLQDASHILLR